MSSERSQNLAGHISQFCQEKQSSAHDFPRQRRQAAGHCHLVRQFLPPAASGRAFAARLQARHIDDHAGPSDPDVRAQRRRGAGGKAAVAGLNDEQQGRGTRARRGPRRAPSSLAPIPRDGADGAAPRDPEARLARPSGSRGPSISTSSASRAGGAERGPARDLSRQGQGRGDRRDGQGAGGGARQHGLPALAGAAAQSRKGAGTPRSSTAPA